jgi:hypothetical protein
MNRAVNSAVNRMNSMMNVAFTPAVNGIANSIKQSVNGTMSAPTSYINWIYVALLLVFIVCTILFTVFYSEIVKVLPKSITDVFRKEEVQAPVMVEAESIIEKVLPGKKEVFNIASNRYTYTDSAPLCKALGAELATYEQVKDAQVHGADWCNYGWVKGQMVVYPTQESTWKKLQEGPVDQRTACGRPGMNGGYFDNPDMRFGVNCYGTKPEQSAHDAATLASGAPQSADELVFDQKVAEYKSQADTIAVNPFREGAWRE